MNSILRSLDTTNFSYHQKAKYFYYSGILAFYEDNNQLSVDLFLKAKNFLAKGNSDLRLKFNINDKLLASVRATEEYILQPTLIIDENCNIAQETKNKKQLYKCLHYQFADAIDKNETSRATVLIDSIYKYTYNRNIKEKYGEVESNIAHMLLTEKQWDSALYHYKKSLDAFNSTQDTLGLVYVYNNLGNFYKRKGDYDTALSYLQKADSLPIAIEESSTKKVILKNIADVYYFKGEYEKAALQYEKFALISNSLDRSSHAKNVQYFNTKFQTAEKEKQILLEQEQKVKNRNIAYGLGGASILIGFIGLLVYKNTKRKQRIAEQEKTLEIQKKEKILKDQELNAIDAMIVGQEKERERLASDLHDSVGATLSAAKLQFDHLLKNKDKVEELEELFQKTGTLLDEAYTEIRSMAHLKNSGVIAKKGLLPAVTTLAKNASATGQISIEVQDFGLDEKLDSTMEITIFRVIQELITNIIKHSEASEASISITQHKDMLSIIVEDNGKGFNTRNINKKDGMGLSSIEKRIEYLEGTLEIDSTPKKGTSILIEIPL